MARVRFGDVPADEERSEYERWAPGTYQKMVPLDNLHEHPDNWDLVGRIDDSKRGSLKEDISRSGIREPLQVWLHDGQLVVVSGHERLLIARELGLSELPCVKVDFKSDEEAKRHIFMTNFNRKLVKPPSEELITKLFPRETNRLLYADLRANYNYGALSDADGTRRAFTLEQKREARRLRDKERQEQNRLRNEAAKVLKIDRRTVNNTVRRVNKAERAARKKTEKPRELTPEERKKRDALDRKLTVLRDKIEKKDVQFERLREDLRELRGEERRIVRMLEKFGQPELFE